MRRAPIWVLMLAPLALAACDPGGRAAGTAPPVAPAAKVVGEPRSCIPIARIRQSRVRDDATIDFIGNGGEVWRVTLPNTCPQLKSEGRFTYDTSLSQLCGTDIIYVLQSYGGTLRRGAGCGLAPFVPVQLSDAKEPG